MKTALISILWFCCACFVQADNLMKNLEARLERFTYAASTVVEVSGNQDKLLWYKYTEKQNYWGSYEKAKFRMYT
ncbi:hypothetical protein, partial [Oceaniferula marina]|uniref:hypothetical protein n=1 Tax=Oceaniferula marina TaxID=2748318 RepID=UPI001D039F7D